MDTAYRITWIDLLRACAILAVVLCHAVEGVYSLNLEYIGQLSFAGKLFAFLAFTLGRIGVPLFLLISGYLLLDRGYDAQKTFSFYKNNCLHLLICTEIWIVIYDLFTSIYQKSPISICDTVARMLFLKPINAIQMWYLPLILGLYLLISAMANGLRSIDWDVVRFPLAFFILYFFGSSLLYTVAGMFGQAAISPTLSSGFCGGTYGIYLLIGYAIKKGSFKQIKMPTLLIVSFLSLISAIALQITAYHFSYPYNIWYNNFFLLIFSISIFEIVSRITISAKFTCLIEFVSTYSFPVFLLHSMAYTILLPFFRQLDFIKPIKVGLFFLGMYLSSLGVGWLIHHIPYVGNYILYLKAERKSR